MGDRQNRQINAALTQPGPPCGSLGIIEIIGMTSRNKLRNAGRTARQQQERDIRGFRPDSFNRRPADIGKPYTLHAVAVNNQISHARMAAQQLLGHCNIIKAHQRVRNNIGNRPGEVEYSVQLPFPVGRQSEHRLRTDPKQGEEADHECYAIRKLDDNVVAFPDTQMGKTGRSLIYPVIQLPVGDCLVALYNCSAVAITVSPLSQMLAERQWPIQTGPFLSGSVIAQLFVHVQHGPPPCSSSMDYCSTTL
ncbi:hypothetical protein D3C81_869850 [compost metagenome]